MSSAGGPERGATNEAGEPQAVAPARRALARLLIAGAGAAALWIAALPLDGIVPAPPPPAPRTPALPDAPAPEAAAVPELEATPREPSASRRADEGAPSDPVILAPPPPAADWFEETPGESVEPPAHEELRARLQRQLAMNDLHGVRIELAGDRVVTSGVVAHPGDRQRLALIVRSLAPDRVHEDHAEVAGGR